MTLQLLQSLEFTLSIKSTFLNHDVWRLPYQFVNRIGELSKSILDMDTIENMNRADQMLSEAENYAWAMGEKRLESLGSAMARPSPKESNSGSSAANACFPTSIMFLEKLHILNLELSPTSQ